jgi:hypothetical protein
MRVVLKGIDGAIKRLADGSTRTYYYAWRGGPRLEGQPGAPEFVASYNAAVAERPGRRNGKMVEGIVDAYLDSQDFATKRDRTRRLSKDRSENRGRVRRHADCSAHQQGRPRRVSCDGATILRSVRPRQADYAYAVLALLLSWPTGRGTIDVNPCERGGKLYSATRADKGWCEDVRAAFLSRASHALSLAFLMAIWTGQRQGDLLALT